LLANLGVVKTKLAVGKVSTLRVKPNGGGEQVIGREGETATFLSRCVVSLTLRVIGFAPRQFNRSTAAFNL